MGKIFEQKLPKEHILMAKKHMETSLTLLLMKEMQIKITTRSYYITMIIAKIKKPDNTKCW